jgi:hypothetical protein
MQPRTAIIILFVLSMISAVFLLFVYENQLVKQAETFYGQEDDLIFLKKEIGNIKNNSLVAEKEPLNNLVFGEKEIEQKVSEIKNSLEQKMKDNQSATTLTPEEKEFIFNPKQAAENALKQGK